MCQPGAICNRTAAVTTSPARAASCDSSKAALVAAARSDCGPATNPDASKHTDRKNLMRDNVPQSRAR
ncbi:hypothetical protein LBMAG56_40880 [Verrucomicrobiota bacterium]|nr:hypothetical protein LBMAG56_40880 [Verrucomicrobiota bacterium]